MSEQLAARITIFEDKYGPVVMLKMGDTQIDTWSPHHNALPTPIVARAMLDRIVQLEEQVKG